jgi:CHAD domain-containing protein
MLPPLKKSYERRRRDFKSHFALAAKLTSTDAIHEMRVDLKRLRTFFCLVEAINPRFRAEEAFRPARRLFRAAGRVRNLHVLKAEALEASKAAALELSEYYNWLKEREAREARKFIRACRRFNADFFACAWRSIVSALDGPAASRIGTGALARLSGLIRELQEQKPGRSRVRRLHFLRTRAKGARYTLEVVQELGLAGDEHSLLNDRLRAVHQPLGRWHDEEVVLESLREFRRCREPGPLQSFKSYLGFSRLRRARKADNLAGFEAAWAALSEFLAQGAEKRILKPPSARRRSAPRLLEPQASGDPEALRRLPGT